MDRSGSTKFTSFIICVICWQSAGIRILTFTPLSIDSLNKWSIPSRTWRRNAVVEENTLNTSSLADCTRSKARFMDSLVFRITSMLAGSLYIILPCQLDGTTMCYSTLQLCFDILVDKLVHNI